MAFSFSYVIKLYFLFVISISSIALEVKSDQNEYGSPYMLLRLKRNPQRAYTFGGFSPSSGYAAFATSDFYPSYYNILSSSTQSRGLSEGRGESFVPSSSENSPNAEYPPSADYQSISDYSAGNGAEDERKVPSSNLTPPSEYAPSINYAPNSQYQGPKKAKKKPFTQANDEDEDEDDVRKSKSTSNASFNAWFPIVLGMYPSSQGNSESYKDGSKGSLKESNGERRGLGTTVISNSVSHGRSSVASSHAIAYGGDAPLPTYRKS